jgi:hypothetical protein
MRHCCLFALSLLAASYFGTSAMAQRLQVSPSSLSFSATTNGPVPAAETLEVTASRTTRFTASASGRSGRTTWLAVSPSGRLSTNQNLTVSVNQGSLAAGTYTGSISLSFGERGTTVRVTLVVARASRGGGDDGEGGGNTGGGGTAGNAGFKLIGWNDLGMHCMDGKGYEVFGVLPPYNTIHAHLLDASGNLITAPAGYTVTYQAINDPLHNTLTATSAPKTNFWQYALSLGFGALAPDAGLKGFAMPGTSNTPQAMTFETSDNTWIAEGIPTVPYADAPAAPYPTNYFPMMRLVAKDSSGTVLATTDIVTPTSDEMTCSVCHSSSSASAAARPANGWVNDPDPVRDVKLNILRKHDERFQGTALFQQAALVAGYSGSGLEATVAATPVLCARCHSTNALGTTGVSGVPALTTAMHGLHTNVSDPATNQTLGSSTTRESCYRCHPGPNTQCLRGAMGSLKNASGANEIECQNCHGPMSAVAVATRRGWLDVPTCQSCHTGTAVTNSGQIVYDSVFSSGVTVRVAADSTFATNADTPSAGLSMYRYSKGHGGLQCEACHGSTHAEFPTPIVNDNVQSISLQGHDGMLAECSACHSSMPNTINGGPHGLHPIGASWVSAHEHAAEGNRSACQACHGTDYRGTILSKTLADRTLAGRSFPKGAIISCYTCHNGPNGGD